MPNKSRTKDNEDSIDTYIEIALAEEEVEEWMTKPAARLLTRGGNDRAS